MSMAYILLIVISITDFFQPLSIYRLFDVLVLGLTSVWLIYYTFTSLLILREMYDDAIFSSTGRVSTTKKSGTKKSSTTKKGSSHTSSNSKGSSVSSKESKSQISQSMKQLTKKQKKVLNAKLNQIRIRLLILVPECLASVLKVFFFLDRYSYYNLLPFGFINLRFVVVFLANVNITSLIINTIVFNDIQKTFASSRKMQVYASLLDRNKAAFPFLIVFTAVFPTFFGVMTVLSLYKLINFSALPLNFVLTLLAALGALIALIIVSESMRKEAKQILVARSQLSSSSGKGGNNKVENLIKNVLYHRKLALIKVFGVATLTIGLGFMAFGNVFGDPNAYFFAVVLCMDGSIQINSFASAISVTADVNSTSGSNKEDSELSSNNFSMKSSRSSSRTGSSVVERGD